MAAPRQPRDRHRLCRSDSQYHRPRRVWLLSAGEYPSGTVGPAVPEHGHGSGGGVDREPCTLENRPAHRPSAVGKGDRSGAGHLISSWNGVYLGNGAHGLYPILGPPRLARSRDYARYLGLVVYSRIRHGRCNGDAKYGALLDLLDRCVLAESPNPRGSRIT